MFEQSTLSSGSAAKRLWATCAGISGEALLVVFAMLAPMLWPQVLPRTRLITSLLPPVPPGRPKPDVSRPPAVLAKVRPAVLFRTGAFVAPRWYPDKPLILVDLPTEAAAPGVGVEGGVPGGVPGGGGEVLADLLGAGSPPLPKVRSAEPAHPPAAAPTHEVKQVKVGGIVKMAEVLRRVEPLYPAMARQMRIAGVVELVGVIATDGHLKEVRLISGHPLLARAAMEAVSQWFYKPTTLNGEPVEVIATITVTFHLN
jgi:TonB family protein